MNNKGFTLVELSLVILIIGIISGTVIVSTSLIKSSKLKTLISEGREYHQAYDLFKERFNHIPGDFPDGAKYWGNDCEGATSGDDLCSGGGNYDIEHGVEEDGNIFEDLVSTESIVAWKHLVKAELISGSYTGLASTQAACGGAYQCVTVGENVPAAKYDSDVGFYFITSSNGIETGLFAGKNNHSGWNSTPFLLPKDAYSLDVKIDDGDGTEGYFRGEEIVGVSLSGGTCISGGDYDLDGTSETCGPILIVDWLQR